MLELIERKAEGEEIAIQPQEEERPEVPDLMAALEASIASAKRQSGTAAEKKPAAEKPAAKKRTAARKKPAAAKAKAPAKKRAPAKKKPAAKK